MKTQISRLSQDPDKRYSAIYQQQGRMLTDADWNELVGIFKGQLETVVRDVIGSGVPRPENGPSTGRGLSLDWKSNSLTIHPGLVYVDGHLARYLASETTYKDQHDFPGAPGLPAAGDIIYLDVWDRVITALEDPAIVDSALAGADTCTRTQTLVQVKRAPAAVDPENPAQNPPIGTALLTIHAPTLSATETATGMAQDTRYANCLFRLEVHQVSGPATAPTGLVLKWSSENGAEGFPLGPAAPPLPEWFQDDSFVHEYFNNATEKSLGVHLVDYARPAGVLAANAPPVEATGVRRWDGYCVLNRNGTRWELEKGSHLGAALAAGQSLWKGGVLTLDLDPLTLELELGLGLEEETLLAGDYWLAALREGQPEPLAKSPPAGIRHAYRRMGQLRNNDPGQLTFQPNPAGEAFPALSALGSLDPARSGADLIGNAAITADSKSRTLDAGTVRDQLKALLGLLDSVGEASATGVVVLNEFKSAPTTVSQTIDPGFGPGKIGVTLGLEHDDDRELFVGHPDLAEVLGTLSVALAAIVDSRTGKFHIAAKAPIGTPRVRVRWWAIRPRREVADAICPLIIITPDTPRLDQGATLPFAAQVAGDANQQVRWSVDEPTGGGTITPDGGLYTAPAGRGTFHIRATSVADANVTSAVTVTINAVSVVIEPRAVTMLGGATRSFAATVTGATNKQVTWSIAEGATGGDITPAGSYTAPAKTGTFHVRATSQADATVLFEVPVTVEVVTIDVNPRAATVLALGRFKFAAVVSGTASPDVDWSVVEPTGGSVDGTGAYAAPATAGVYHVRATSRTDHSKYFDAAVTVEVVSISIAPKSVALFDGKTQPFTVAVAGTANPQVTWSIKEGSAGGYLTGNGVYTAPGGPGTFHVQVSSNVDPRQLDEARVDVTMVNITISPLSPRLFMGEHMQFTAGNEPVKWDTDRGSINQSGLYVADRGCGTFRVYAQSTRDPRKVSSTTVQVVAPPQDEEPIEQPVPTTCPSKPVIFIPKHPIPKVPIPKDPTPDDPTSDDPAPCTGTPVISPTNPIHGPGKSKPPEPV